ncbi:MAG: Lrp/AsnC family transcriptional regulator [Gammaproteobacteria bacterium]|nr:Lrp/AsnC family transcriptional regulator [Gammaproteobacteria bacterium]
MGDKEKRVVTELQHGLPITSRPYAVIASRVGLDEAEVVAIVQRLRQNLTIKRFGVIVRHHELGYRANAMVVWDIPDNQVADVGQKMGTFSFVTLCYRRARQLPEWPYNLYCMIHGREQQRVLDNIDHLIRSCDLKIFPHEVLFSGRRFKQRGAVYQYVEAERAVDLCPTARVGN